MNQEEKAVKIMDTILNKLWEIKDLDRNTLFIVWDIFRSCYGEDSCIHEHNRLTGEILCELDSK